MINVGLGELLEISIIIIRGMFSHTNDLTIRQMNAYI